jgi:hypothetical protein
MLLCRSVCQIVDRIFSGYHVYHLFQVLEEEGMPMPEGDYLDIFPKFPEGPPPCDESEWDEPPEPPATRSQPAPPDDVSVTGGILLLPPTPPLSNEEEER